MKKKRNVHKNEGTKEMQVGSIVTPENEKQQCGKQKWGKHVPFFFSILQSQQTRGTLANTRSS